MFIDFYCKSEIMKNTSILRKYALPDYTKWFFGERVQIFTFTQKINKLHI